MDADASGSVPPTNDRERRFVLWVSALIVLLAALLIGGVWYLFPRGLYQYVAPLDSFPPSEQPYFVAFNNDHLIIVNTGDDLRVFDGHSTRPNCEGGLVYWQEWSDGQGTFGRMREPCHGAAYDLNGVSNIRDGPPARALDSYSYDIRDGDLWVCFNCLSRGAPFEGD